MTAFFVISTLTDPLGRDELIAIVKEVQKTGIQYVVVPAKVQERALSDGFIEGMRKMWGVHVADPIPEREAVRQAVQDQLDLFRAVKDGQRQYRKGAQEVAAAYAALGKKILDMGEVELALRF